MRTDVVLTVTGPDRVGIVEEVSRVLLAAGGNVGTSRMARLGGEFAILMQASIPADLAEGFELAFGDLVAQGYCVSVTSAGSAGLIDHSGWSSYRIDVVGADHEGIVHHIARGLSRRGISIESMDTGTTDAPTTGATLFTMSAVVVVPPHIAAPDWMAELEAAAEASGVDVEITALD